jgi:hypothetical protein
VTVVVGLVILAPAVLPGVDDDFPFSTFPMFTYERGAVVDLDTVVLVDGDGRHRLSPETVGGTDEIVSAAVAVDRAITAGPAALERFCTSVAARLDGPGSIEVVTERHDAIALLRDGAEPDAVTVHARCEIP